MHNKQKYCCHIYDIYNILYLHYFSCMHTPLRVHILYWQFFSPEKAHTMPQYFSQHPVPRVLRGAAQALMFATPTRVALHEAACAEPLPWCYAPSPALLLVSDEGAAVHVAAAPSPTRCTDDDDDDHDDGARILFRPPASGARRQLWFTPIHLQQHATATSPFSMAEALGNEDDVAAWPEEPLAPWQKVDAEAHAKFVAAARAKRPVVGLPPSQEDDKGDTAITKDAAWHAEHALTRAMLRVLPDVLRASSSSSSSSQLHLNVVTKTTTTTTTTTRTTTEHVVTLNVTAPPPPPAPAVVVSPPFQPHGASKKRARLAARVVDGMRRRRRSLPRVDLTRTQAAPSKPRLHLVPDCPDSSDEEAAQAAAARPAKKSRGENVLVPLVEEELAPTAAVEVAHLRQKPCPIVVKSDIYPDGSVDIGCHRRMNATYVHDYTRIVRALHWLPPEATAVATAAHALGDASGPDAVLVPADDSFPVRLYVALEWIDEITMSHLACASPRVAAALSDTTVTTMTDTSRGDADDATASVDDDEPPRHRVPAAWRALLCGDEAAAATTPPLLSWNHTGTAIVWNPHAPQAAMDTLLRYLGLAENVVTLRRQLSMFGFRTAALRDGWVATAHPRFVCGTPYDLYRIPRNGERTGPVCIRCLQSIAAHQQQGVQAAAGDA